MQVSQMLKLLNKEILLRNANESKVDEYAERMEAGVEFPSIKIGRWPKNDKYGETGIVDGVHRLLAAKQAGKGEHKSEVIDFKTVNDALAYMYTANMSHGLPPTEGQRNSRIKLMKQIDPSLTLEKIADQFKLGKSSIDRILKGGQGEGKSGAKTGSKKSAAHKSLEVMKPAAFFKALERVNHTLERVRAVAAIVDHVMPETKEGVELDTDLCNEIKTSITGLAALLKELNGK